MVQKSHFIAGCTVAILLVLLIALGIRDGRNKHVLEYQTQLKQYVLEVTEFSEEEKQVICAAIDHIRNPETIIDDKRINVYRVSERFPKESDIDLQSKHGTKIEPEDWQVDIGNRSEHGNFTAIMDGETFEFIMQIPIA